MGSEWLGLNIDQRSWGSGRGGGGVDAGDGVMTEEATVVGYSPRAQAEAFMRSEEVKRVAPPFILLFGERGEFFFNGLPTQTGGVEVCFWASLERKRVSGVTKSGAWAEKTACERWID